MVVLIYKLPWGGLKGQPQRRLPKKKGEGVKGGRRELPGEKMSLPAESLCYYSIGARQNIKISSRFSAGRSILLMEVVLPSLASGTVQ